jgi:SAM-dependent methyltransferase
VSNAEERLANDPTSELWGEHRSRYRFAASFLAGRPGQVVLDVASGAGFGLDMLHQAGARAIGVDYDASALSDVRQTQSVARLVRGDAMCLPLGSGSIDLVVSFETIEHVRDAAELVGEVRRVLKPGGRLVLSTPNRDFGPRSLHTNNPFHIREFTADELRDLLCERFADVRVYGQRPSATYRYVPFLMIERHLEPSALAWKLLVRLPFSLKNRIAHLLTGRPVYPAEDDYLFDPYSVEGAHALLAVAT